jgi:glycosyltransferase involved in cell wall biosynthesis
MKLGVITPGFSAHEEDWAIPVLQDLIRALASDHNVRLFSLRYPPTREVYTISNAQAVSFAGGDVAGVRRILLILKAVRGLLRSHRARPFDLLHAFWADEPGFTAASAGHLLGIPVVISLMGGELVRFSDISYGGHLSRLNRFLTSFSLNRANLVTAGSRLLADMAAAKYPAARIQTLPLGLDDRWFEPQTDPKPHGFPPDATNVLSVASLIPVKDPETMLRAFALASAAEPVAHLHILGDGTLRRNLEGLAQELGLRERATFYGRIPHKAMTAFYRSADLLLVSSRYESQCMAAVEAAASGLPIAGTRVGILPELDGAVALAPPGNPLALTEALSGLLANPARRMQMGRHALELAKTRYRLNQTSEALTDWYRSLTAKTS